MAFISKVQRLHTAGKVYGSERFLGLWKDTDPDIPTLPKAKAKHKQLLAN
jgi:hypothetical protein